MATLRYRAIRYTAWTMTRTGPNGGETTVTPGDLQRVGVLLTAEQYAALRKAAYERGVSQSEVVRLALDAYLRLDR